MTFSRRAPTKTLPVGMGQGMHFKNENSKRRGGGLFVVVFVASPGSL